MFCSYGERKLVNSELKYLEEEISKQTLEGAA
jgi:hypothetical protein